MPSNFSESKNADTKTTGQNQIDAIMSDLMDDPVALEQLRRELSALGDVKLAADWTTRSLDLDTQIH